MTRVTVCAGAAFVCGIAAAAFFGGNVLAAAVICVLSAVIMIFFKGKARLFGAFLIVGAVAYTFAYSNARFTEQYTDQMIGLECTVEETNGVSPQMLVCSTVYPNGRRGKIGIYQKNDAGFSPGDSFTVRGKAFVPSVNKSYYASKSVFLLMFYPETTDVVPSKGIRAGISALRRRMINSIGGSRVTDSEELLTGMLFGSRFADLSPKAEDDIRNAGAGHIAAVSGLHLSAVVSLFIAMFGRGRRSRFIAAALSGLAVCFMADFSMSVIRAYAMLLIITAAPLFKRRDDPLTSLFAVVLAVGIVSPLSVTSASFVLSCAGVFGAAVLPPKVCSLIGEHIKDKKALDKAPELPSIARTGIVLCCIAAVMMPVSAVYFERISLASPLTNLLLSPLVTLTVSIGAIGCLLFLFVPSAGYVCFVACRMLCTVILKICAVFSGLVPTLPSPPVFCIAAAIVICAAAAALTKDKRAQLCTVFSVSAILLIGQSIFVMTAPDTVLTEEGTNGAMLVSRECRVFINGEGSRLWPFEKADVIICGDRQMDWYRNSYPECRLIGLEDTGEYDISGVRVMISEKSVYAGNENAEVEVMIG